MGYYINNTPEGMLPAKGKAKFLIERLGARPVDKIEFQSNLVCVVDNGPFDAAAYAYNQEEFDAFYNDGSTRTKHWLIVPNADILSGFKIN